MSIELWARSKGEKYFGDILRICRSFEHNQPETKENGIEDKYLNLVIIPPQKRNKHVLEDVPSGAELDGILHEIRKEYACGY